MPKQGVLESQSILLICSLLRLVTQPMLGPALYVF